MARLRLPSTLFELTFFVSFKRSTAHNIHAETSKAKAIRATAEMLHQAIAGLYSCFAQKDGMTIGAW